MANTIKYTNTDTLLGPLNTTQTFDYNYVTGFGTNYSPTSVNIGDFELFKYDVNEKLPPNSIFSVKLNQPGIQTTPPLARGDLAGSSIDLLNNNLTHVCDFKFIFDFNIDLISGLINPATALRNAIKNAKLKATNRMRSLIQDSVQAFRKVLDAIIQALGFDPSGQISFYWSLGKDIIRTINEITEYIAEKVEIVLEWIYFAQQIKQLVDWILSLPDKIKAMLANCIANFNNSIKQIANDIKTLPSKIGSITTAQAQEIASQFTSANNLLLNSVQEQKGSSGIPQVVQDSLSGFNTSDTQNIETINNYIYDIQSSPDYLKVNAQYYQFKTAQTP
jgi:hypothetical protein